MDASAARNILGYERRSLGWRPCPCILFARQFVPWPIHGGIGAANKRNRTRSPPPSRLLPVPGVSAFRRKDEGYVGIALREFQGKVEVRLRHVRLARVNPQLLVGGA